MRSTILLFGCLVVFSMNGLAHGGGLNKCGCHMNRKTNTCHCHRAPRGGCGPECYSRFAPWSESTGLPDVSVEVCSSVNTRSGVKIVPANQEYSDSNTVEVATPSASLPNTKPTRRLPLGSSATRPRRSSYPR